MGYAPAALDAEARAEWLAHNELFEQLPRPAIEALAAAAELIQLVESEPLLRQGEADTDLFAVVSGNLVIKRMTEHAGESVVRHIGPGTVVGEMQALTGGIRTATTYATTPCDVLRFAAADVERVALAHPILTQRLARLAKDRIRRELLRTAMLSRYRIGAGPLVDEILEHVEWIELAGGDVLVEEGDDADALFVLTQGRLRAGQRTDQGVRWFGDVLPLESLGESAMLPDQTRSATVWASRPSEAAKIDRAAFMKIAENHPVLTQRLLEVMVQRQSVRLSTPVRVARTVAFIPASADVPIRDVAIRLSAALDGHDVAWVDHQQVRQRFGGADQNIDANSYAGVGLRTWLDDLESSHELVVLEGDHLGSSWSRHCADGADEIVLVGRSGAPPPASMFERLIRVNRSEAGPRVTLLLLHPAGSQPSNTRRWLEGRDIETVLHIRGELPGDYTRAARLLTGTAVGLVLSGGAARSFAGIGVIRALHDAGVPIDAIGGVSAGALVSALFAGGASPDEILDAIGKALRSTRPDFTVPLVAMTSGKSMTRMFEAAFSDRRLEDLPLPCLFVSTNLSRACQRVSTRGEIWRHLHATNAMPGLVPPALIDGDLHVDGALINNVPIAEMKRMVRGGPVVAMDVTPTVEFRDLGEDARSLTGWGVVKDWVKKKDPNHNPLPSMVSILLRSQLVHHVAHLREVKALADLYLQPDVARFGVAHHHRYRAIAEVGYEQSQAPIRSWWAEAKR